MVVVDLTKSTSAGTFFLAPKDRQITGSVLVFRIVLVYLGDCYWRTDH